MIISLTESTVVPITSTDQMPSLKMKAQSSTGCLKDKNGLRVCQKSCVISKQACSHVKSSEHTADFNSCKYQAGKQLNIKIRCLISQTVLL